MKNPRIVLYAQSIFGMGHFSIMCALAKGIKKVIPGSDVLILSGAPLNHFTIQLIPRGVEFIKLPSFSSSSINTWRLQPATLNIPNKDFLYLRRGIVERTITRFRPDVFCVDHNLFGVMRELSRLFSKTGYLRRGAARPIKIFVSRPIQSYIHSLSFKKVWTEQKIKKFLSPVTSNYDYVFVTGPAEVFWNDFCVLGSIVPKKEEKKGIFFTGYCTNKDGEKFSKDEQIKRKISLKSNEKMIVLACGGGRDGYEILDLYLRVHDLIRLSVKTVIFPGPYMPEKNVMRLKKAIRGKKGIHMETFKGNEDFSLADWMSTANIFIGMAGLNTLAEILTARTRAVIMPRHPDIEEEQFIHASILSKMGLIEMIDPKNPDKASLLKAIERNLVLGKRRQKQTSHMINGSIKAAKKIKSLIEEK